MPRQAILHYIDFDGLTQGPSARDPLWAAVPGVNFIEHIYDIPDDFSPKPIKKLGGSPMSFITSYRKNNRRIRPLGKVERLDNDVRTLITYNYAIINNVWTFPRSGKAGWNMYNLLMGRIATNVNEVVKKSGREHFFIVDLPSQLPGLTTLRTLTSSLTVSNLAKLPTFEEMFIFDLFRYLGRAKEESLLNSFEDTSKITIVLKYLDKWITFNLGWLEGFVNRKGNAGGMYDPTRMEVVFLRLIGTLHAAGVPISSSTPAMGSDTSEEEIDEEEDDEVTSSLTDKEKALAKVKQVDSPWHKIEEEEDVADDEDGIEEDDSVIDDAGYTDSELKELEKELLELEKLTISAKQRQIVHLEDIEVNDDDPNGVDDNVSTVIDDVPLIDIDILSNLDSLKKGVKPAVAKAEELVAAGVMSSADFKRITTAAAKFEELVDPYGNGVKLTEFKEFKPVDFKFETKSLIADDIIIDKSMARSTVDDFRKNHINHALKKQIVDSLTAIQKGPVSVTSYDVEVTKDAVNHYETHIMRVVPTGGEPSVIRQIIPVVNEDGTFLYNGNRCSMRSQRADLPIRKVTDTRVALSSYYGKCFVERSSRRNFNYSNWLVGLLVMKCQDPTDPHVKNASVSNVTNFKVNVPNLYARIGTRVAYFEIGNDKFNFDHHSRKKVLGLTTEEMEYEVKTNCVAVGRTGKNLLLMDVFGNLNKVSVVKGNLDHDHYSTLEELLAIDVTKAPVDSTEVKVLNKSIPTGFCLGYLLGLENLLKLIKADYRRVLSGTRLNLMPGEYPIAFRNETLVFKRNEPITGLIMGGWNQYKAYIADKNINVFDNKDVYAVILEKLGVGNRYVRQLDSMSSYFVDPITEKLLIAMGEPTSFTGLLVRSVEMLVNSYVPRTLSEVPGVSGKKRTIDIDGLDRIRGYERFAGFAYEAVTKAMNRFGASISSGRAKITVNPFETMTVLMTDPTVSPVDNLNPIQYLREREVVTTSGRGGRNKRSMVASTRVYQDEDMGIISEASVDSGDVGVIVYMPQDAKISSIFGTYTKYNKEKDGMAALISTASLISPHSDGDDQQLF